MMQGCFLYEGKRQRQLFHEEIVMVLMQEEMSQVEQFVRAIRLLRTVSR